MRLNPFNLVELTGLVLIIGGVLYSWATHKPDAPPSGLVVVEFGIAFVLLGALFSVFTKKK